jgi:hypothetical protein
MLILFYHSRDLSGAEISSSSSSSSEPHVAFSSANASNSVAARLMNTRMNSANLMPILSKKSEVYYFSPQGIRFPQVTTY